MVSVGMLNTMDILQRSSSMVLDFPSTVLHIVQGSYKEFELQKKKKKEPEEKVTKNLNQCQSIMKL